MGYFFHFSSLYPAPYIELYMCYPIKISKLNFKAVLALPKTTGSAQRNKSLSLIWIVWSTLFVYLWFCVCARLHQSATHCCRRSLRCAPPPPRPRLLRLLGVRGHLIDFSPQNWSCYFNDRPLAAMPVPWCVLFRPGLIWVLNCRMIIMITVSSSPGCT